MFSTELRTFNIETLFDCIDTNSPVTLKPVVCLSPSPVPMWAIGAIVVVVLTLVCCMAFCIYKKCFNKAKKPKKVRERKGGRGRRKKDKDGEEGGDGEKKVRRDELDTGSPGPPEEFLHHFYCISNSRVQSNALHLSTHVRS